MALNQEILSKPKSFYSEFFRKVGKDHATTHYCPGCGHGRIHKLIAEALDQLEMTEKAIFISPVGCSVFAYWYFDCGNVQAAHGRAPAVGTGIARANPDSYVISYQGDGDLAAIGTAEIIHAANRGENMVVFFVNNAIYGMTGGQMAPTTLEGQKTTTSPYGRNRNLEGLPIRMSEIIAQLEAPVFVERVAVTDFKHINKAKKAIYKALKAQKDRQGFSFVEILSPCPTANRMSPLESVKWVEENMFPYFPLQNFKDETATRPSKTIEKLSLSDDQIFHALGINISAKQDVSKINTDFIKNFKDQYIRIAGFGGQGVLVAGVTLAMIGMCEGLEVSWLPSYGPEMRGGTANCHVVISSKPIGSPLVSEPNVLIAMNGPSLDEFEKTVQKGGLILVNSSMVDYKVSRNDVNVLYVPVTEIAASVNLRAAANMVALAAYMTYSKIIPVEKLKQIVTTHLKKKHLVKQNLLAIDKGVEYIKSNY